MTSAIKNQTEKVVIVMKPLVKIGIGIILFGIICMILISVISLLAYGKIYMYDGYAITGVLWTICFIIVGMGAFLLAFCLSMSLKDKNPKIATAILIGLLIVALLALFKACGALGGELNGDKDDTCGICGGDGVFQGERCWCVGRN